MEQQSVLSADGTRIAWTTFGSGAGVIVCPGSLSDGRDWFPVAKQIATRMTVHVMSRRGTGASGDALEHSIQRESEDVVAVLASTGASSVIGHSYGAVVSLEAALAFDGLERLVVYEPPLAVDAPFIPDDALEEIERAGLLGDIERVVDTGLRRCVKLPGPAVDAARASPIWASLIANGRQWPREIRALAHLPLGVDRYSGITAVTLLLSGNQTPTGHHHRKSIESLATVIPHATVIELTGVGHEGHLQDPTGLATTLLRFLR